MLRTLKVHLKSTISLLVLLIIGINPYTTTAQSINPGDILRGGTADANLLLEEYFRPFGIGFGDGLNSGWFTSPKPHQKYGFDFRIGATAAIVPDFDRFFRVDQIPLQNLKLLEGPNETPTFFGDDSPGARLGDTYINPETGVEEELYSFDMPIGVDFPYVVTPIAQLSFGLIRDTDISIRFVPKITIANDYDTALFGLGVQHGLSQWLIPEYDKLDLSVQFGYTKFGSTIRYRVDPDPDSDVENNLPRSTWDDQNMRLESDAMTSTLLFGRQMKIISFYGGIGVQKSVTTLNVNGSYPLIIPQDESEYEPGGPTRRIFRIDDPVDLEFVNATRLHYLIGTRIRVATITLSASYTFARYNNLNVGFGVSFR
tara:strand:- start:44156 stop:45268 length:1113 start_codon:yes stop_codon:yes gene_type:complete